MQSQEMVTIKLQGGLGNQLFQYAAGFNYAKKYQLNLCIDASNVRRTHDRKGILEFNLPGLWVGSGYFKRLYKKNDYFQSLISKLTPESILEEEDGILWPSNYVHNPKLRALSGWFQSWKIASEFIAEGPSLELKRKSSAYIKSREIIKSHPGTILHVRRGDYKLSKNWGLLSEEYYLGALNSLGIKEKETVHIFSDDILAVRDQFKLISKMYNANFVDPTKLLSAAETLSLMKIGKKICIGNSTLSWWSAMLAGAIPIACPKDFYLGIEANNERYPAAWVQSKSRWEKSI